MKTPCRHLLISAVALAVCSIAGAAVVQSTIKEVSLYTDGGQALREVHLNQLIEGESFFLDGLPGSLDPDGIQIKVLSGEGFRISAVKFERVRPNELPRSPAREAAEVEVRRIETELYDLRLPIEQLTRQIELYAQVRIAFLKALQESPDSTAADQIWAAQKGEMQALAEKTHLERAIAAEWTALQLEKSKAEKALQDALRQESALNGRISIDWIGSTDGPVVLELRTRFSGAGWAPHYRIDARPLEGVWKLTSQARLRNATGEDWNNVNLTLLTGRPSGRTQAPVFNPIFLAKITADALYAKAPMASGARRQNEILTAEYAAEPVVERLTTQFVLQVPGSVTVSGFTDAKSIELSQADVKSTFWSAVTPSMDTTAYLHGEAVIDLRWPLLPGPAVLLVDGAESGRFYLPFINTGDKLELGFGENPAIIVEHKNIAQQDRNTGIIDKVRRYNRHFETSIHNHMPIAHQVRVQSGFPLSKDNEIEVKRHAPADRPVDPETGAFSWDTSIAPDAKVIFSTRYEVIAPRDWYMPPEL